MNTHRIHRVAKLTGLSKDVIRVWERRYGLITPMRGTNRYRNYTDEDVALLRYVRAEMEKGHSIGEVASVGREVLLSRARSTVPSAAAFDAPYERLLAELVGSLEPLDRDVFERRLNGAVAVIPFEEALHKILLPLQQRIGQLWHDDRLSVAVEHYVTKQVQQKLFSAMNQLPVHDKGPKVVVACPPGEMHEVGAQSVAYVCGSRGCRVYYLGPNVPISSLAGFCAQVDPDLVLLSLTSVLAEEEAANVTGELSREVAGYCPVVVGGAGAREIAPLLERSKIELMDDLRALERRLVVLFAECSSAVR